MKEKYSISGMTCSSCANHVYDAVSKLNGVQSCNVNLLLNSMEIEKEDSLASKLVIEAVEQSGYKAQLYTSLSNNKKETNKIKIRLIFTCALMFILSYISMAKMLSLPIVKFLSKDIYPINFAISQAILTLIIYIINHKRVMKGLKQLISFKPTMDSLIGLSCFASYVYGLYILAQIVLINDLTNQIQLTHSLYFETGAMVLTFSSIGKYLEALSKVKTTSGLESLLKIAPDKAIRLNNEKQERINASDIKKDDILLVKPGAKIPTDGVVIHGNTFINQSSITGESLPVEKNVNDQVISGTLNCNGTIQIKAICDYKDSTFSKVIDLVSEAANSKAPISLFADKVSRYFIPSVIALSIITFIVWHCITRDFLSAFSHAMSVLVVSCPCALGLATPTAIMVTSGKAAQLGFIYKNASIIEETSKIKTLVFDKTNTITQGNPEVEKIEIFHEQNDFYDILYSLEFGSEHPLSKAILDFCSDKNPSKINLETNYKVSVGIESIYNSHLYAIGNEKVLKTKTQFASEKYNGTILYFVKDDELISKIYISDQLKANIQPTLQQLNNYQQVLLTGDNETAAKNIANQVGIKAIYANVLPQEKQSIVQQLMRDNKVAMIGDGINDTIALTTANIGIAINNATDVAIESSNVVVLNDNITTLVDIFGLSKISMHIIKQNLLWALGYNCLLIPIAAGLFNKLGINLNPMLSSLAMSLSSITVVTNALRINAYKPFKPITTDKTYKYEYRLEIDHMMCEHCQKAVENALLDLGIISQTKLPESIAIVKTNQILDISLIKQKLESIGYHLTNTIKKES